MSSLALKDMPSVALDEVMRDAALTDRVDTKYIVERPVVRELLERLAATHRVLSIGALREFRYETTYYDSPDLLTLREHRAGRRRRFKVRRRDYLDGDRRVLEVKLKGSRGRTVKHSMPYDGGTRLDERAIAFARCVVRDAYGRELPFPLEPVLTVSCRRATLVCPERGERLTIDLALDFGGAALRPGHAIVESKSAAGRSLADAALRDLGVRRADRCSKYCLGMTLARADGRVNDVLPLVRGFFDTTGAVARAA